MTNPTSVPPPELTSVRKTPGLATASLVLGIVSVLGAAVIILPTILAIVFGHIAYSRIRKDPRLGGSGIALAGLVLGYVSILFGIFTMGLLAAMAIPAFEKVREQSLEKSMQNDARQIGVAAQQVMLENGLKSVVFHIDPNTGSVSGPLSTYVHQVTKGTQEVDGTIENESDTFSLRNPHVRHGQEVVFDSAGRRIAQ
jgi:Domain of unknown function (DUF4190)